MKIVPVIVPPVIGNLIKEVREISIAAPHTTGQWLITQSLLDEYSLVQASLQGIVIINILSDSDTSVHNGHKSHIFCLSDLLDPLGKIGVS